MMTERSWRRDNYISVEKREAFLQALRERSLNTTAACREAGLASTAGVYSQKKVDPEFAARWQEVEDELLDEFEQKVFQDARVDPQARRWVLSRLKRERWGDRAKIEAGGTVQLVHSVQEIPSDKLEQLIRERYPDMVDKVHQPLLNGHELSPDKAPVDD